jgi:universal stress protein A
MASKVLLCAVSMGECSAVVLNYAVCLAQAQTRCLRVMHVFKPGQVETQAGQLQDYFRRVVPAERRAGLMCEFMAEAGDVAEQIAQAAQERDVEFVVIGYRGAPALGPHRVDEVAARAGKPVLGVPASLDPARIAANNGRWGSIVYAAGLAGEGSPAHSLARSLAEASGARLVVVHVVQDLPSSFALPDAFPASSYRDAALEEASGRLDAAFGGAAGAAPLVVRGGDACAEIARLAKRVAAELVIVGFHRDSPHLTGSLLDRLLARGDCAVLAVPHLAARAAAGGPRV